jgi:hypothetical protein
MIRILQPFGVCTECFPVSSLNQTFEGTARKFRSIDIDKSLRRISAFIPQLEQSLAHWLMSHSGSTEREGGMIVNQGQETITYVFDDGYKEHWP